MLDILIKNVGGGGLNQVHFVVWKASGRTSTPSACGRSVRQKSDGKHLFATLKTIKRKKKCSLFLCKGSNKPFQLLLKYCFEKLCSWWSLKLAFMELIHHINYFFPLNNKQVHQFTMAAIRSANKKIIYIKKLLIRIFPARGSCNFQMAGIDNLNCCIIWCHLTYLCNAWHVWCYSLTDEKKWEWIFPIISKKCRNQ